MIDYHVHLEEGPYSFRWLERTAQALQAYEEDATDKGYRQNVERQVQLLSERLQKGCFSEEWLDLYLQQAKRLGLREVGIVDHLYRFKETRAYFERYMELDEQHEYGSLQRYWLERVMTENIDEFIETIQQAKEKWREQGVTLKLGVEADYFIGGEEELAALLDGHPWDFVIGSVHFVDGWGFDNPQTEYIFKRMDEAVLKKHYQRFFETVEGMIASNLFDFVAHLDNFKVFNYKVQDKVFLDTAYKRIAKALITTNTATEINAGLYYRYPVKEMCPSPRFLQTLLAYGVEFTVSSDAHFPDDLGKFTFENAQQLKNAGVSSLVTFNQREKQYIEIE